MLVKNVWMDKQMKGTLLEQHIQVLWVFQFLSYVEISICILDVLGLVNIVPNFFILKGITKIGFIIF